MNRAGAAGEQERFRIEAALKGIEAAEGAGARLSVDSPFKALITTILSQATNWRNVELAAGRLEERVGISPGKLLKASLVEIKRAIAPAGLHNVKSKKIKALVKVLYEKYGGDLGRILSLPGGEAREKLMELPGVGRKTADVVLAFVKREPTLPVDTHVSRIAKRLKVVGEKAGYEEIKAALESFIPPEKRLTMHLAMIRFGRAVCKAVNPRCGACPIANHCPTKNFVKRPRP